MDKSELRKIAEAARPTIRAMLDATEELAAIRDAATAKGIDWSQLKSLLKAQEQDARDGKERVARIVEKADFASSYADMLGMRGEDERKNETRSSPPEEKRTVTIVREVPPPRPPADVPDIPPILDRRARAS